MPDTGFHPLVERFRLLDDGLVPNNATLPLTVYRTVFVAAGANAEQIIEAHFARNNWSNAWVNGIYDFQHYHATAHEVLGIARGWADVQFGGANGPVLHVFAGDAVLIPAGVAHCRIASSHDLSVVGAYPGGTDYDLCRATAAERTNALPRIANVAKPSQDPVTGAAME